MLTKKISHQKELAFKTFLTALLVAIALFLPFIIYDKGYFIFYGDFNVQQIPFYQMAHDAVRSGNVFWSWTTDLGANFIGSYSFYLIGSPFFWITLLFPSNIVPYLMGPLLIFKLSLAALTAYWFLRRFVKPNSAFIGSLLYAFSGYSMYNIFFNHFHEALIYFPLMLLGIELLMSENKHGLFAISCFLSALSNFYFFIGQAFFLIIYWIVRASSDRYGLWKQKSKGLFILLFEAIIGTAAAGVILLPAFFTVIQNNRVARPLEGWDLLIYSSPQRFFDVIHSFFFPQDIPAYASFFPDSNNKWSSMSAWIPLFGMTGVIAYFQSRKHNDWIRRLLVVCGFLCLIPGLNAMFQLFNKMYYARWYYMMVLVLVLATVKCFDEADYVGIDWKRAFVWSGGITVAFTLVLGLLPTTWDTKSEDFKIGLYEHPEIFWINVAFTVISLVFVAILINIFINERETFNKWARTLTITIILLFGLYSLIAGKIASNFDSKFVREKALAGAEQFDIPDMDAGRIDFMTGNMDNLGMYWQTPTIQAFHSVVPGSVMEFYPTINVSRDVASRPGTSHYALRGLTSVKWLFDYDNKDGTNYNKDEKKDFFDISENSDHSNLKMPGWEYYDSQNGFHIYQNQYYIPFGFTYESYLTRSQYNELSEKNRELALLKSIVIEDDQEYSFNDILIPQEQYKKVNYTISEYYDDCIQRADTSAHKFEYDNKGFTAKISMEKENLVFFSVPYEEGWSATVNGKETEIVKANVGFMAVRCPEGESNIRFNYVTPGLKPGIIISAISSLILIAYIGGTYIYRKKKEKYQPLFPTV